MTLNDLLYEAAVFVEAFAAFATITAWFSAGLGFLSWISPYEGPSDVSRAVDAGVALGFVPGAIVGIGVYIARVDLDVFVGSVGL
jgi:hypothetical protein